ADPQRLSDASLQYAYGLAIVRSGRVIDAEPVFAQLLREHGDTPELAVLVGQAHAQQGDYDAAVESLRRARQLQPQVADASAARARRGQYSLPAWTGLPEARTGSRRAEGIRGRPSAQGQAPGKRIMTWRWMALGVLLVAAPTSGQTPRPAPAEPDRQRTLQLA